MISPAEMDNKEPGLIEKAVMCGQFEKFHSSNKSTRSLIDLCHLLNIRTQTLTQVDDNKIWLHLVLELLILIPCSAEPAWLSYKYVGYTNKIYVMCGKVIRSIKMKMMCQQ